MLSKLPRLIHIPALTESKEIESDEKKYALGECLSLLFEDLIGATPLAGEIQTKLNELEKQMEPSDSSFKAAGFGHKTHPLYCSYREWVYSSRYHRR